MSFPRGMARWAPPAAAMSAVVALIALPPAVRSAGPAPTLPGRPVEAVVADVLLDQDRSVSGTIRERANLGLPDLPTSSLGTVGTVTGLLTGTHTLHYWQSGKSRQRLAILDTLAETDLVRVASTLGVYESNQNAARRVTVPKINGASSGGAGLSARLTALIAPGPDTVVIFGSPARIAGRDAYTLELHPRQAGTLVDHVEIAADAGTGTALRIRVYAKGYSSPALEASYTSITFHRPADSLFGLINRLPAAAGGAAAGPAAATAVRAAAATPPGLTRSGGITTVGAGWATIVRVPLGPLASQLSSSLGRLSEPAAGGRLIRTRLLTAFLAPDGSLWVGAVPADALLAAAAAA